MNSEPAVINPSMMSFFNRDHVVVVTIENAQIVVTTTLGVKITIPASAATLARFVDDLANHVQSNFVTITAADDEGVKLENQK